MIDDLCQKEKTLVISTHDIDFAYEIADYIYILDKGEIVKKGNKYEIFDNFEFLRKLNLDIPNILKVKEFLNQKDIEFWNIMNF